MKRVPLKDLKRNLSHWVEQAEGGEVVQITRHNRACAQLSAVILPEVIVGPRVGEPITPALNRATRGRFLQVLLEDREE